MSVSHASPSFLHSHRHVRSHSKPKVSAEMQRRHRENQVLAGMGLFLLGSLAAGFVGIALTNRTSPGPSAAYGADGAAWVLPSGWSVLWLAVTLLTVVAIFAYGIATAAHNQQ